MQCKNIPDIPVLEFLRDMPLIDGTNMQRWATWFWQIDYKPDNSVVRAMPEGTPAKLALAKMRMLMRRGLVDGCGCGCRGDFVLTNKGRELLTPNAVLSGSRPE